MQAINIKQASISALVVWVIGVSAFIGSYFIPIMDNLDDQANWALTVALVPAVFMGVYIYYRRNPRINWMILGGYMFFLTMILDAMITVPLFIIPAGGNHLSFFGDPGFWVLGVEYLVLVGLATLFLSKNEIKMG
ncbi:MAG: DUF5367 family protein [Cyclobacteriaceae bacterium]|uniref:DUF5367 family protein n=1 Tax=Algoriphagus marincola TaxID=264027 RepID=UPI00047E1952|nr:DUF5367 family protein [Algoriphagus marincola]MCR9080779.1 DUF5367 family protein [Cyclobacteriaceae bacterium]